jgi:hypothetical protein
MSEIRYISYDRSYNLQKSVLQSFNSFVSIHWGRFTTEELNDHFLKTREHYIKQYTKGLKHNKVRDYTLSYLSGYVDGVKSFIENNHTVWAYKIFGKFYGCFERDPFPRYDTVFPREVWANPDFPNLGLKIWKETKNEFYGYTRNREDLPKYPYMAFSVKNNVFSIRIKIDENPESQDVLGSFPVVVGINPYTDLMNLAKTYNVSIINMEEV